MTDLVARLRRLSFHAKHLADNENLHALYVDAFQRCEQNEFEAANEIERLTKERDEARREICENVAKERNGKPIFVSGFATAIMAMYKKYIEPSDIATERGWDCFERKNK